MGETAHPLSPACQDLRCSLLGAPLLYPQLPSSNPAIQVQAPWIASQFNLTRVLVNHRKLMTMAASGLGYAVFLNVVSKLCRVYQLVRPDGLDSITGLWWRRLYCSALPGVAWWPRRCFRLGE